jgi:hypothetical protein
LAWPLLQLRMIIQNRALMSWPSASFYFFRWNSSKNNHFVASLWKFNTNYWTSGRMNRLNGSFLWCPSNSTFDNTSSLWGSGQPGFLNSTGHCVHLSVSKTLGNVSIARKNCTNFYVLGCQVYNKFYKVPSTRTPKSSNLSKGPTTPEPPCHKPICPALNCTKNVNCMC